jgi:transcriptional regulator GlxA family with amidase domain
MREGGTMKVGILVFEEVEELDLAGPWEVFGTTNLVRRGSAEIYGIGSTMKPVRGNKGLRMTPDVAFGDAPDLDLLIIPGGEGTRAAMKDPVVLDFVRTRHSTTERIASVCTGAFVLAEAGLLDRREATTHWLFLDQLRKYRAVSVRDDRRFVDAGDVLTSGGVACGIDMALHIVRTVFGGEMAAAFARGMCYVEPAATAGGL